MGEPLGFVPIVSGKLNWLNYQESRTVGYEADADTGEKQSTRETRIGEGKMTAEQFDEAADATTLAALKQTLKQLETGTTALESLAEFCDEKFGNYSPSFIKTRDALGEISQTVKILIGRKPPEPDEEEEQADDAESVSFADEPVADIASTWEEMAGTPAPAAAPGDVGDAAQQLAAICRFMRANNPEDPAPYLILRGYAWAWACN